MDDRVVTGIPSGPDSHDVNTETGTFLVTHTDPGSAVLRAVTTGQIYPVAEPPELGAGDILLATLEPADATASVWAMVTRVEYPLTVESSDDPPPETVRRTVQDTSPGTLERLDRAWGELHAIAVPDAATAITDIVDDPATRSRAARIGARHVIVRGTDAVVGVEYRRSHPD